MTYGYQKYEWTAFTEADFLNQGGNGTTLDVGDKFKMPGSATVKMSTWDNDGDLSGDSWYDEKSNDQYGQAATVNGVALGGKMYAESYHVLQGSDGKKYYLIEIEVEGHDAPGAGDDYFTFYGAVPPAGVTLCVVQTCNVTGCWVDFNCLGAGTMVPPNTPPSFTNVPADGIFCIDENQTFVIDLNASDADHDTLTYEIVGGADAAFFTIDPATGVLSFKAAPDYENPKDGGANNIYDVTVKVSDGKGGHEVKPLWVKVKDVEEGDPDCVVIEAEDMTLCNYKVEGRSNASGGEDIVLTASSGYAKTTWAGPSGDYDFKMTYMDESDGNGAIKIYVNGTLVKTLRLNQNNDGAGGAGSTFSEFVLEDLHLNTGDVITLKGIGNCYEYARIDKIEICKDDEPLPGALAGRLFCDENNNNVDDSEPGIGGVTVTLLSAAGAVIATTTTAADGSYSFTGLAAGDYAVRFPTVVNGKVLVDANQGGNDAIDSDASQTTGQTGTVTVVAGQTTNDVDAGVEDPGTASIAGRIFCDENDNSVDDTEPGVGGVTVTLLTAAGAVVATTTTAADGSYSFAGLKAGDYKVDFPLTANGKVLVNQNVGANDAIDSDASQTNGETGVINLSIGEASIDNDAGVEDPGTASIAGRVFCDSDDDNQDNNNGDEPGVGGVTVTLLTAAGAIVATTTTAADGTYAFTGLKAGDYKVDFPTVVDGKILVDANVGNDASDSDASQTNGETGVISLSIGEASVDNDAGVEDPGTASLAGVFFCDEDDTDTETAGDKRIAGATVELLVAGVVVATTTTGADGSYAFTGLNAGAYQVRFVNETGKVYVLQDVGGDDTIDSDVNPGNGTTGVINLVLGENKTDIDAGVEDPRTAALGDRVFIDANGNGQQDDGEVGVAGVAVTLCDANGNPIATTSTDANGNYLFSSLAAGVYAVAFAGVDGFDFTTANVGNDATDSDADQNTGKTGQVTLAIGETNLTVDAGVVSQDPTPQDDMAKTCANEAVTVDVLANDSDPNGDVLTITAVDGQAIAEGGSLLLADGVLVSLEGGQLVFDAGPAYIGLDIGEEAIANYTYTVSDGNGGTADANVQVTYCGSAETLQDICDSLPDQVNYQIINEYGNGNSNAFTIKLSGSGDVRLDGLIVDAAYCVSAFDPAQGGSNFTNAPVLTADIYCTNETATMQAVLAGQTGINGQSAADNLDLVNWILNQDLAPKFNDAEVQAAIWSLTDGLDFIPAAFGQLADVRELVSMAVANGEGFEAGEGDIVGLILNPNPITVNNAQPFIVGVSFDQLDCLC